MHFFDPDKSPEVCQQLWNSDIWNVNLESDGKSERVEILSEQTLTNALIKVTREGSKVIYFMVGHGEHDIESLEKKGFWQFEGKNCRTELSSRRAQSCKKRSQYLLTVRFS